MFGISMWEVVLILVIALIFLGPRQLAETARVFGKMYRELQKMMWDIRNSVDLDSLTSMDSHHHEPPRKNDEAAQSMVVHGDLVPPPGEKTGPDFYAELMEKATEEDKKAESSASADVQEKKEEKIDKEKEPKEAGPGNGKPGA
ncbi:MAG: twin-arginine translocase TatA/TatE family subunit [Desulfomonilaceae bacterium]